MTDNIAFSPAAGTQIGGAHPDFNNWLVEVSKREGEGDAIIYGAADSSCSRSLWLIRELEHRNALKIKHVPILSPRQYNAETDKINPHRKMPFLDDKGTYLFESMAINLYLVKKYGSETDLAAKNLQEEASFLKWSSKYKMICISIYINLCIVEIISNPSYCTPFIYIYSMGIK